MPQYYKAGLLYSFYFLLELCEIRYSNLAEITAEIICTDFNQGSFSANNITFLNSH